MASINYAAREINVKIVYYGPGLSGKTTNLQIIHRKVPPEFKSDMVSLATETDRTLFFDFLPLDLGKIKGFATKFQLYTVPGQVYYNATRKLVLRGVDGVVFVADSGQDKIEENLESFQNLEENLAEYGYKRESIPIIIQYNKRDLPNALPVEDLERYINKYNLPWSEAVANKGIGVFDSLKLIGKIVIDYLNKKYSRGSRGASGAVPRTMQQPQATPLRQPPPRMQQQAPSPYNQLGQAPQVPPQQRSFQGGPVPPMYPPQMRQPSLPQSQMPSNRGMGPRRPQPAQQPYMPPPRTQGYVPAPENQDHFEVEPIPQPQRKPRTKQAPPPVQAESYDEHSFEPSAQHHAEATAPMPDQQDEYFSYGSINLEPMDPQQAAMAPQHDAFEPSFEQQPSSPQQQSDYNVTGKTDLDMEIERYQREIEEKQRRIRGGAAPAPQTAPHSGYVPSSHQEQPPRINPQQQAPAADHVQKDYDVYNMDMQAYTTPQQRQQQAQPMIGANDEEEMFFTSVDTDRQKKPVRRPVNPRTQQQKGFLSKFFNKDMS